MSGSGVTIRGIIEIMCLGRDSLREEIARDVESLREETTGLFHFLKGRAQAVVTLVKYRENENLLVQYTILRKDWTPDEPTEHGYLYLFTGVTFVITLFIGSSFLFPLCFGLSLYSFGKAYKILLFNREYKEVEMKQQIDEILVDLFKDYHEFTTFHYLSV